MTWLEIDTQRFPMGSNALEGRPDDDESPVRDVTVGSFRLASAPVTVRGFGVFVDDTGVTTTAELAGTGFVLSEGELILVGGADWRHPYGPDAPPSVADDPVVQVSWYDATEYCRWAASALPTEAQWASASTHHDITRHAVWCADFYDATFHRSEQRVNPTGPTAGLERVIRGGQERRTARSHHLPDMSSSELTFRTVTPPNLST